VEKGALNIGGNMLKQSSHVGGKGHRDGKLGAGVGTVPTGTINSSRKQKKIKGNSQSTRVHCVMFIKTIKVNPKDATRGKNKNQKAGSH